MISHVTAPTARPLTTTAGGKSNREVVPRWSREVWYTEGGRITVHANIETRAVTTRCCHCRD